jgi:xanthine dehydrogenase accessory factor
VEELERVYEAALDAIRRGEPVAMATVVEARGSTPRKAGAKMLITADGRTVGTVGGGPLEARVIEEARAALADGQSRELHYRPAGDEHGAADVCGGDMRLFVEVLLSSPTLLIVGAGHIGQALAELGAFLGYRIAVLDERAELVTPERFPQADRLLTGPLEERLRALPLTDRTYAVLVTPHHSPDEKALAVLAGRSVAYVGLLGGRRRSRATFERARALGVPDAFLARVHTPVGLDIGAETPREIAVSILAEVIAVQRGRDRMTNDQ